jgi:hypothetical protein
MRGDGRASSGGGVSTSGEYSRALIAGSTSTRETRVDRARSTVLDCFAGWASGR